MKLVQCSGFQKAQVAKCELDLGGGKEPQNDGWRAQEAGQTK